MLLRFLSLFRRPSETPASVDDNPVVIPVEGKDSPVIIPMGDQTMSLTARKLLSFIQENDLNEIRKLTLTCGMLDEEIDENGTTILTFINQKNNQQLRDIVFENIRRHYPSETEFRRQLWRGEGVKSDLLCDELYNLAAALNQINIIREFRPERDLTKDDQQHLLISKQYGHREVAAYLTQHGTLPENPKEKKEDSSKHRPGR